MAQYYTAEVSHSGYDTPIYHAAGRTKRLTWATFHFSSFPLASKKRLWEFFKTGL